jgi:hypothetical protein
MPTIWDLLPASLWPTQPFIPAVNPDQGPGWALSPAAPWDSAASSPNHLAPDAMASLGWSAPVASFAGPSQLGAYRHPDVADEERYQQMLADAKRASDFVRWTFGPPRDARRALSEGTARAAPTSKDFFGTLAAHDSLNERRQGSFDGTSPTPPTIRNAPFPVSQYNRKYSSGNAPVSPSASETTGQAAAAEPFGGGYAPSSGEFLASRVSAHDLLKRGGARYDLDNYQIVADGAAADHRDTDGNPDGLIFTGPAYIFDPATGAFADVGGSPGRPTTATLNINTGALSIRR